MYHKHSVSHLVSTALQACDLLVGVSSSKLIAAFLFPFGVEDNALGQMSQIGFGEVKVELLASSHIGLWCSAEECYRHDIDVKPLRGSHAHHATQDASNSDKLGVGGAGQRLVFPSIRNIPSPRKDRFVFWEADPMGSVDVER